MRFTVLRNKDTKRVSLVVMTDDNNVIDLDMEDADARQLGSVINTFFNVEEFVAGIVAN